MPDRGRERASVGGELVVVVGVRRALGCRDGARSRGQVQAREEDRERILWGALPRCVPVMGPCFVELTFRFFPLRECFGVFVLLTVLV